MEPVLVETELSLVKGDGRGISRRGDPGGSKERRRAAAYIHFVVLSVHILEQV